MKLFKKGLLVQCSDYLHTHTFPMQTHYQNLHAVCVIYCTDVLISWILWMSALKCVGGHNLICVLCNCCYFNTVIGVPVYMSTSIINIIINRLLYKIKFSPYLKNSLVIYSLLIKTFNPLASFNFKHPINLEHRQIKDEKEIKYSSVSKPHYRLAPEIYFLLLIVRTSIYRSVMRLIKV